MNTLGSWIDQEAFTGIAKDIAPAAKPADVPWFAADAAPVTRLLADDFRLPEHFAPEPFPDAPAAMAMPERQKVRSFLDTIRHKAEQSGLIPKSEASQSQGGPGAATGTATGEGAGLAGSAGWGAGAGAGNAVGPSAGSAASAAFHATTATAAAAAIPQWGLSGIGAGGVGNVNAAAARNPGAGATTGGGAGAGAEAGIVPSPLPPRRHVPHFEVPLGPLTTRLRALTDWIRRQLDAADIFIIDAQGCPVTDREAPGEIVAGAVLLAEAARRAAPHLPSAAEGAIYLDLQDERRLCVIDTVTRHGTFTLGLIVPDALAPRAADRLRRALRRTVEVEGQPLTLPPRERW